MKKGLSILLFLFFSFSLFSQTDIEWQVNLGGSEDDAAWGIQKTLDGGYIIVGQSESDDGDVGGNNGGSDFWIVKLSSEGELQWEKNLGGSADDIAWGVQQTFDDGYIVAGQSNSNNGDVGGNNGGADLWVVKLSDEGVLQWERVLGGSADDKATKILQTNEGGYLVIGYTFSDDGDVSFQNGMSDYWIIKLDNSGNLQWEKSFGGNDSDVALAGQQTTDGGYVIAGYSFSDNGDVGDNNGWEDFWIIKLTETGELQWEKNLGGTNFESPYSIQQTMDGGYIAAGFTNSDNGDVGGNHGGDTDYWVVKLSEAGELQWESNFGGFDQDDAMSVHQTSDGNYIVAGYAKSEDGDVTNNHGVNTYDYWLVRLNDTGDMLWQQTFGGSSFDMAYDMQLTSDGGYVVAGASTSTNGDVSENNGGLDFWIIKLSADNLGIAELGNQTVLYPNPTTGIINIQTKQKIKSVSVYNSVGQKVSFNSLNKENTSIDISGIPDGIYFIEVILNNNSVAKKYKVIKK